MNLYDIAIARKLSGGGGGGGSSDLSTAEVTITNNFTDHPIVFLGAFPKEEEDVEYLGYVLQVNSERTKTSPIAMYKSGALMEILENRDDPLPEFVSVTTGSVTVFEEGMYYITGDCTITINEA